jgi:hypothetical protein
MQWTGGGRREWERMERVVLVSLLISELGYLCWLMSGNAFLVSDSFTCCAALLIFSLPSLLDQLALAVLLPLDECASKNQEEPRDGRRVVEW